MTAIPRNEGTTRTVTAIFAIVIAMSGCEAGPTADDARHCDMLAGRPSDTRLPEGIDGVAFADIDSAIAIDACRRAVAFAPSEPRYATQLARALEASGQEVAAFQEYLKVAEQGSADAQNQLGNMYLNGTGVEKNTSEANRWYRSAAEQGDAVAQFNLGTNYLNGDGVEKNASEAASWLRKSAEQDYADAQNSLAVMISNGWGVEKNTSEAVSWYRKSAQQDNAGAQFNLGVMYLNGNGVEKNVGEAVGWFRRAAEQGQVNAQHHLGWAYEYGKGVEKNLTEALHWYGEAAAQGELDASESLDRLQQRIAWPERAVAKIGSGAFICMSLKSANKALIIERTNNAYVQFPYDCQVIMADGYAASMTDMNTGISKFVPLNGGSVLYTNTSYVDR